MFNNCVFAPSTLCNTITQETLYIKNLYNHKYLAYLQSQKATLVRHSVTTWGQCIYSCAKINVQTQIICMVISADNNNYFGTDFNRINCFHNNLWVPVGDIYRNEVACGHN